MIQVENHNIYQLNDLSNIENVNRLKDAMNSIPSQGFRWNENNYLYEHKDTPGNLFRILDEGRFLSGAYYILTDKEDNFKASTGWYMYQDETEGEVAMSFARSIVHPNFRNLGKPLANQSLMNIDNVGMIRDYLFLPIIEEIKSVHQGKIWQSINKQNRGFVWKAERDKKNENYYYKPIDEQGTKYRLNYIGDRYIHYTWQYVLELEEFKTE